MKLTLEQARERYARLMKPDAMMQSFIGGRVGFRKPCKKYDQELNRLFKNGTEANNLREFIEREEEKLKPKEVKPSIYFETVEEIETGKQYTDCIYGLITVVKKNKNTVTIQTSTGYKETRKPHFIYRLKASGR